MTELRWLRIFVKMDDRGRVVEERHLQYRFKTGADAWSDWITVPIVSSADPKLTKEEAELSEASTA